ncbi:hypothetical protein ARMSODRAFT_981551 [Armillaria solidipes]|uniref:Uncharacterized protein n=1 Tax=Armillaria solidipes TaxID=1076256 RepID=A0A2H3ARJ0_9AGAR|nr:hypothetical protein ARMSODRAFT_981551 [Armillaria solidipes]
METESKHLRAPYNGVKIAPMNASERQTDLKYLGVHQPSDRERSSAPEPVTVAFCTRNISEKKEVQWQKEEKHSGREYGRYQAGFRVKWERKEEQGFWISGQFGFKSARDAECEQGGVFIRRGTQRRQNDWPTRKNGAVSTFVRAGREENLRTSVAFIMFETWLSKFPCKTVVTDKLPVRKHTRIIAVQRASALILSSHSHPFPPPGHPANLPISKSNRSASYVYAVSLQWLPQYGPGFRTCRCMSLRSILVLPEMPRNDPGNNCIRGLIFHQYRAAPQVVPLKFVFRQDDNGEIVDCIPHVNGFFPPAQLAYRRVGGRGSDPPFELWYYKNQMQLAVECPDSANDTIVSLSCSLELNKLWYGSVVAVMLEKTEGRKRYTNFYKSVYRLLNLSGLSSKNTVQRQFINTKISVL